MLNIFFPYSLMLKQKICSGELAFLRPVSCLWNPSFTLQLEACRSLWQIAVLSLESLAWHRGPPWTHLQDWALQRLFLNSVCRACITDTPCQEEIVYVSHPPLNEIPLGQGLVLVNVFTQAGWSSVKVS